MSSTSSITAACTPRSRRRRSGNRQNEELILDAEKLAAIDSLFGAAYPENELRRLVEENSVQPVPRHPARLGHRHQLRGRGAQVRESPRASATTRFRRAQRSGLARRYSDGVNVLVFNPLSWARTGEVEAEVQFPLGARDVGAVDFEGKPMPVAGPQQRMADRPRTRAAAGEEHPATGYKLIQLLPRAGVGRRAEDDIARRHRHHRWRTNSSA